MDRATGDLQLIRLVRQYPYLYDTTSDNYKNIKLKETVWKKISSTVGLPVDTSKTRWKSLRTSYLRHCKLIACRKKESTKCRKWPLADELTFLNPYLVPPDYTPRTPDREEPEPLSDDAMARVYGDPSGRLATSPHVEAIVGIEEEDDEIEEIIEHIPQDEDMQDAFSSSVVKGDTNGVNSEAPTPATAPSNASSAANAPAAPNVADSVSSDESYSSVSASVEPDHPPSNPRADPRNERRNSRFSTVGGRVVGGDGGGVGGGGIGGSVAKANGMVTKRESWARHSSLEDEEALKPRDTTRDFFLYLAETVKTFPPYLQAQVKGKCFEAVNSAELSMVSRAGYTMNNHHSKMSWNA